MVSARGFIQHHFFTVKCLFNSAPALWKNSAGFTLIEVTLVLGIIGILASVTLVALNVPFQLQKARDGTRKSNLRSIQSALEVYRTDATCYPGNGSCAAMPSCTNALTWTSGGSTSTYMQKIPCDPTTGASYSYTAGSPANGYTLDACLENTNDNDPNTKTVAVAVCSSTKQYEVTSP